MVPVSWGEEAGSRQGVRLSFINLLLVTAVCQALVQVLGCEVNNTDQVPALTKLRVSRGRKWQANKKFSEQDNFRWWQELGRKWRWLAEMGGGYLRKDDKISESRRGGRKPKLCPFAVLLRALADLPPRGGCQCLSWGVQTNLESHKGSFPQFCRVFKVPANPDQPSWPSQCLPFLVQPFFWKHRNKGRKSRKRAATIIPHEASTSPFPFFLVRGARAVLSRDPCWTELLEDFPAKGTAYWNFHITGNVAWCFQLLERLF